MNSLTVQYALDYEEEGFTFMALCPGVSSCCSRVSFCQHGILLTFCLVDEDRIGRRRDGGFDPRGGRQGFVGFDFQTGPGAEWAIPEDSRQGMGKG